MPSALTITMRGDPEKRHGAYIASLLQGVIMERIDPAFAQRLHESAMHPYSQFTEEKEGQILWHVHALTKEAEEKILRPLAEDLPGEIELRHRQETLTVLDQSLQSCSYEELIEGFYLGDCSRSLPLQIRTPMAFKQGGKYCIFPTTRLLFQNLMMRFDACSPDSMIFTPQMLEDFESLTEIADYRLRSVRFSLEGVKIPAFAGEIRIRIKGPQQMANTAWMLAKFGEYAGIGIKTGIGMGAVSIGKKSKTGTLSKANTQGKEASGNG